MLRTRQLLVLILAIAAQCARAQDLAAVGDLDIDYAELQPLVSESVLLDVVRLGNRLVAVGERGHVVFSDDGEGWQQAEHVPTRSTLTTVVTIGERMWAGGHDAIIITSGDGGNTWSRQYFAPERQQAVMDFHFTDRDNGVALGSYGLHLVTTDGGRTWSDQRVDEENDFHLNGLVRFPDGRRMIAGEAGYSYRSFDDGETWEAMTLPYAGSMWGAIIVPGDCIVFFGLRGHMMESCDFGDSWQEIATGTQSSLSGAAEWDDQLIVAGNSGTVLSKVDGKVAQHIHSSGVDFAAVLSLGDGHFLLVGEEGVHRFPESVAGGAVE
jgi:photosystem II stability/assembly factor-like uncharacterized protein